MVGNTTKGLQTDDVSHAFFIIGRNLRRNQPAFSKLTSQIYPIFPDFDTLENTVL